jgi:hypothetical protein
LVAGHQSYTLVKPILLLEVSTIPRFRIVRWRTLIELRDPGFIAWRWVCNGRSPTNVMAAPASKSPRRAVFSTPAEASPMQSPLPGAAFAAALAIAAPVRVQAYYNPYPPHPHAYPYYAMPIHITVIPIRTTVAFHPTGAGGGFGWRGGWHGGHHL